MTDLAADWSPADNPYAIAVSEAHWWLLTVKLAIARIRDGDDPRISFSSQQIDARQLVVALSQLLVAERLEQAALRALAMDQSVRDALAQARHRFEAALPGIKHMRDALMHFDEWSRGTGHGPQYRSRQAGEVERDVARAYWRFAYDPNTGTISLGPYSIDLGAADDVATRLSRAINSAAHQVDARSMADLRARTVQAITTAGLPHGLPDDPIQVSSGTDMRIWVSVSNAADSARQGDRDLATRIVDALSAAELHLVSFAQPGREPAELLVQGLPIQVEAL